MKYFLNACLIFFLFNMLTGCSNKTYPTGNYQQTTVKVDGDLGEWNEPLRFRSSGGLVQYNVTNDNDNIYISLETHDEATALKILRSGVNIYIDAAAGQSKKMGIAFPLANTSFTGTGKSDRKDMKQILLIQAVNFSATGFKNMDNRQYDIHDTSRIRVAIKSYPNNSLGYEAAIPLQYIFGTTFSKNSVPNISVGIVINAMTGGGGATRNPNYASGSGGGNHGGGHGGGGGGGRGMHSGGGGNSRRSSTTTDTGTTDPNTLTPDRTSLYKQDTNWYKFRLAGK